jgi:hypothetical protein
VKPEDIDAAVAEVAAMTTGALKLALIQRSYPVSGEVDDLRQRLAKVLAVETATERHDATEPPHTEPEEAGEAEAQSLAAAEPAATDESKED